MYDHQVFGHIHRLYRGAAALALNRVAGRAHFRERQKIATLLLTSISIIIEARICNA
jgi:hypothetical protein